MMDCKFKFFVLVNIFDVEFIFKVSIVSNSKLRCCCNWLVYCWLDRGKFGKVFSIVVCFLIIIVVLDMGEVNIGWVG